MARYEIEDWTSIYGSGKYKTRINILRKEKIKDTLRLITELVKKVAKLSTEYYIAGESCEYIFAYSERQLDTILVPAFREIVNWEGSVLVQCPTKRYKMPNPLREKNVSEEHSGWIDYRIRKKIRCTCWRSSACQVTMSLIEKVIEMLYKTHGET